MKSPSIINPVPADLLQALAGEVETPPQMPPANGHVSNGHAGGHRLDVARWLKARGVAFTVKLTPASGGRTVYLIACPFDNSHVGGDTCIMQDSAGKLSAHCFHNSCAGRGWQEFKAKIGPPDPEHYDPPRLFAKVRPPARDGQGRVAPGRGVRTLEPYQPFPVEALPEPLGEYVRQGALALGCDPAYLALPALAVAASVIGNRRTIRLKRGWDEPCIIWSAIVGDSGTLKSPAYLKAVGHLFQLQRELLAKHKARVAKYREEMQEHQAAKRKAKEGGTDPGAPPAAPLLPRVVVSDTTVEKLAEILEDNPDGILVARDELAGWLGSFTRYKGKAGGTDLPNWLEMHRAGTVIVDRKTSERQTLYIPRAAVSITGGIQPGVLARALTPDFLDAGLAARLLLAMPPKQRKRWSEVEIAPDVERAYEKTLDALLALDSDIGTDGEKLPYVMELGPGAKRAWVDFYDEWAREQAAAEGELAAALSKLEGYAARFALLHHVVGRTARGQTAPLVRIRKESVDAGVTLCRWFAAEVRRIYAMLSESTEERDSRRLVEFIRARGGRIRVRTLQMSNPRKYPTADVAEAALEVLVQAGLATWSAKPSTDRGGRPTRTLILSTPNKTQQNPTEGSDGKDEDTQRNCQQNPSD